MEEKAFYVCPIIKNVIDVVLMLPFLSCPFIIKILVLYDFLQGTKGTTKFISKTKLEAAR